MDTTQAQVVQRVLLVVLVVAVLHLAVGVAQVHLVKDTLAVHLQAEAGVAVAEPVL